MRTLFHARARRSAYILMEVMLATAIFAIAGVSLAIVLSNAISAGTRVERETRIVWGLETQLNQARLGRLEPGAEMSKADGEGVVYEKEITTLNLKNKKNDSLSGLFNITITAYWMEGNLKRDMSAQTYVYQP